jgi:hypothetical protein
MNHDQLVGIIQQGRIEWSAHALNKDVGEGDQQSICETYHLYRRDD